MAHSDHETRVGAHRIFSVVLIPSPFSPQLDQITKMSEKVSSESFSIQHENLLGAEYMNGKQAEGKAVVGVSEKYAIRPYHVHIFPGALMDGKNVWEFLFILFIFINRFSRHVRNDAGSASSSWFALHTSFINSNYISCHRKLFS